MITKPNWNHIWRWQLVGDVGTQLNACGFFCFVHTREMFCGCFVHLLVMIYVICSRFQMPFPLVLIQLDCVCVCCVIYCSPPSPYNPKLVVSFHNHPTSHHADDTCIDDHRHHQHRTTISSSVCAIQSLCCCGMCLCVCECVNLSVYVELSV